MVIALDQFSSLIWSFPDQLFHMKIYNPLDEAVGSIICLLLMTLWIMVIADGDKIIPPETCCVFCFCWCENRSYIISQIRWNTYKWMCCWNQFKRGNCLIKQNFMFAFSRNYFIHSSNNLIIFDTLSITRWFNFNCIQKLWLVLWNVICKMAGGWDIFTSRYCFTIVVRLR